MATQCSGKLFEFHPLGAREVRVGFDGGAITSDGGGPLLREGRRLFWRRCYAISKRLTKRLQKLSPPQWTGIRG
jgi:hypothetical protein